MIFVHSIIFLTYAQIDFTMTSISYQEYCDNMDIITVIVSVTADRFLMLFRGSSEQHKLSYKLPLVVAIVQKIALPVLFPATFWLAEVCPTVDFLR